MTEPTMSDEAAAEAILRGEDPDATEPTEVETAEAAPESAAPPAAPAPAVETAEVPEPLEQRLLARAQARAAEEGSKAQQAELAELRAYKARMDAMGREPVDRAKLREEFAKEFAANPLLIQEFGHDPRAMLKATTDRVLNPGEAALRQQLAQLQAKLEQLPQQVADPREAALKVVQEQQHRAAVEQDFCEACTKLPTASRLPRSELIRRGDEVARHLQSRGVQGWTLDDVAQIVEERAAAELQMLSGGAASAASSSTTASSSRAAKPAATAVITSDLAAGGGAPRDPSSMTWAEREAWAADALKDGAFNEDGEPLHR